MKLKHRTVRSRLRGTRRSGYGFGKKHRGHGSKGGKGMAGTGKKAGQKLTWVHAKAPDYFGKHGFTSIKNMKDTTQVINLDRIHQSLDKFIHSGKAKKTPAGIELDLSGYKVLGRGNMTEKLILTSDAISASAKEAVEKAGGKVILSTKAEGTKTDKASSAAQRKASKEKDAKKDAAPGAKKPKE